GCPDIARKTQVQRGPGDIQMTEFKARRSKEIRSKNRAGNRQSREFLAACAYRSRRRSDGEIEMRNRGFRRSRPGYVHCPGSASAQVEFAQRKLTAGS